MEVVQGFGWPPMRNPLKLPVGLLTGEKGMLLLGVYVNWLEDDHV